MDGCLEFFLRGPPQHGLRRTGCVTIARPTISIICTVENGIIIIIIIIYLSIYICRVTLVQTHCALDRYIIRSLTGTRLSVQRWCFGRVGEYATIPKHWIEYCIFSNMQLSAYCMQRLHVTY